jgi:hypothetical protein
MRCLFVVSVFSLSACAAAQGTEDKTDCLIAGQWVNERGSAVTLSCEGDTLSGVYNTNVGEPDKGQSFPLTGWAEGDNVSFTVNFKGYGSITAWVGQVETVDGQEQLKTLWHLTRDVEDEQEADDMWKSVTAGASVFRRVG